MVVRRPLFRRLLLASATLGLLSATDSPHAQTSPLRGTDSNGAFPTSPADATIVSPEDNSPPAVDVAPGAEDNQRPATELTPEPVEEGAPNYGKPRKPKPKLYQPNPKTSPPLSKLAPYPSAATRRRSLNPPAANIVDPTVPAPTVAAIPVPLRLKRAPVELDPFIPTGIRMGDLILKPFIETSAGYETNPNQVSVGVKPSSVLRADAGLDLASDFSSSSLTANLRGGYSEFPSNSNANRPNVSAVIDGRVDVTRQDSVDTEVRFNLATQTPGSPLLAVPNAVFITNRPVITSEGTTLGGTHVFGALSVGLKGTFDRTQYGDATQSDGSLFRYSQDNYNDYGVVARASYELTPAIIPFTELAFDSRVRDNAVDLSGYQRDSVGGAARLGATFDMFGYFTGTASAGYLDRHYEDPRLPNLRGPTLDGSIVYAATPLTTLTLRASTTASETTLAGAAGAISRSFGAEVAHVFFRRFTLSGIATVQPNEYQGVSGNEIYTTFTLKGAYVVTRDVQLIASVSRQHLKSSFFGDGFTDNVFLVGVRLQR